MNRKLADAMVNKYSSSNRTRLLLDEIKKELIKQYGELT